MPADFRPREPRRGHCTACRQLGPQLVVDADPRQRGTPGVGVERLGDVERGIARDLAHRRDVARDHRRPAHHGLEHRQTESLVETRQHERGRVAVEGRQAFGTDEPEMPHPIARTQPRDTLVELHGGPALVGAGDEQLRGKRRLGAGDRRDERVHVLARIEGADVQEVRLGGHIPRAGCVQELRPLADDLALAQVDARRRVETRQRRLAHADDGRRDPAGTWQE